MKKRVQKVVMASLLAAMPIMASDDGLGLDESLFGIELGYGQLSAETTNTNTTPATYSEGSTNIPYIGIKLGAQSNNYRVFVNGRYGQDQDDIFDYVMNGEVEGDYMFEFSRYANFFLGVHAGMIYTKFRLPSEPFSRTFSEVYYGGNVGFNFHATPDMDIELGSRFSSIDATNVKSGVAYKLTDRISGYCSIIFKYQMD